MDLKETKIDETAEREGRWVEFDDETAFLVARWMNPSHRAYIQRAVKPYIKKHRRSELAQEVADRIEIQGMAECILLGWRGLKRAGKEVAFSKGEALKILNDPTQSWLVEWLQAEAQDLAAYQAEALEEAVENVGKS